VEADVDVDGGGAGSAPHYARAPRARNAKRRKKKPPVKADPNSPFAALGEHALFGANKGGS